VKDYFNTTTYTSIEWPVIGPGTVKNLAMTLIINYLEKSQMEVDVNNFESLFVADGTLDVF
jgi:hypothetical protein